MQKTVRNKLIRALVSAGILLGIGLLVFLMLRKTWTTPDNPMEEADANASEMYVVSDNLAVDETILSDIENANIDNAGEGETEEETEEEPEEEPEPEENPETPPEEQEETDSVLPQVDETLADPSSSFVTLRNLITQHDPTKAETVAEEGGDGGEGEGESGDEGEGEGPGEGGGEKAQSHGDARTIDLYEPDTSVLFTTSITNCVVTDPDYPFTITLTEQGKKLELISMTLDFNGHKRPTDFSDAVTLNEGPNTLAVTVRFRDEDFNLIDAHTDVYIVEYDAGEAPVDPDQYRLVVYNAETNEILTPGQTVETPVNSFKVIVVATKGDRSVNPYVKLNNARVAGNGTYNLTDLHTGNNTLAVSAGTGPKSASQSFIINYYPGTFAIDFRSKTADIHGNVIRSLITDPRMFGNEENHVWEAESEDFTFNASCTQRTGLEKIEKFVVVKDNGMSQAEYRYDDGRDVTIKLSGYKQDTNTRLGTQIIVFFSDSEGVQQHYSWSITFVRKYTPANRMPNVHVAGMGSVINESPHEIWITAADWRGNELTSHNFTVICNGTEVELWEILPIGYGYMLYLYDGRNDVTIIVRDSEQYEWRQDYVVTYTEETQPCVINLKVQADILGLDPWIDEKGVEVAGGQTIAQVMEDRLKVYGFTSAATAAPDDRDYFLARIKKEGLMAGYGETFGLTEEQIEKYEDQGYEIRPLADLNSLGNQDITTGSGWLVTRNGEFIGRSMGSIKVQNGDRIEMRYTLNVGRDIGVDAS